MAHPVKCFYCGSTFDRDREPFIAIPNKKRYAHERCYNVATQADKQVQQDKEVLESYIKKLFNCDSIPVKISRQLNIYMSDKNKTYTYSGIYKTLKYWYEVKHGDIEKANGGIGIVPHVYDEAYRYWYDIWVARERNKEQLEAHPIIELPTREIHIVSPEREPMRRIKRLFTFLDSGEEDS